MPNFVISGLVQTSQTLFSNESGIVTSTGTLAVSGFSAISSLGSSSVDLVILGDVIAIANPLGVSAVDFNVTTARVFNAGTVVSNWTGFQLDGINRLDFSNSGTVQGYFAAVEMRINSGFSGAQMLFTNSGVLQGQSHGLYAVVNDAAWTVLTNSGSIIGTQGYGIIVTSVGSAGPEGPVRIYNSGTIMGADGAIDSYSNAAYVYNTGLLVGGVYLSTEADLYLGKLGEVEGVVYGGSGGDVLVMGAGNDVVFGGNDADQLYGNGGHDQLDGEGGSDVLYGGDGDDSLDGGTEGDALRGGVGDDVLTDDYGNDYLEGQAGDDSLSAGVGNDSLYGGHGFDTLNGGEEFDLVEGGAGDDLLFGDGGGDTLYGQKGDDTLDGGNNNDVLYGGVGNDELRGGGQRDDLFGGSGTDVFRFVSASESANSSLADTIRDFEGGIDLIDLSGLAGVLQFQGGLAFAGGGQASLRIIQSTNTTISIDTNGDAVADMRIVVTGLLSLAATDFLL